MELPVPSIQIIAFNEFGQLNRKLIIDQDKVIKEYREANQILRLVEYTGSKVMNSEILILQVIKT